MRNWWYGLTVFVVSALLMVLEIVAGRLIAPYVGVSLYTWTAVIGVILAGLSLGNWLGGVWADRGAANVTAGIVLLVASVASYSILLLLTWIAPLLQNMAFDALSASLLYVLALFFVPALLIGIITPLLTTLALKQDTRSGHVVGRMHALSAAGAIIGTFITGFWLIQYFGTRWVIIATALLLFLLALPLILPAWKKTLPVSLALVLLLSLFTHYRQGFSNPCDKETQYYCLRVVNASSEVPVGGARAMIIDHLLHGINHASIPHMLVTPYVHLVDELIHQEYSDGEGGFDVFFAGGGAYTHPRSLKSTNPEARITVAEIDPQVTRLASEQLWLESEGLNIEHVDARLALARSDKAYDVVVGDVFHDVAVPYHLVTREYAALIRTRLKPGGAYLVNIVDAHPDPLFVKSLYRTLNAEFEHVAIWLDHQPRETKRLTYVLSARNSRAWPRNLEAQRGFRRQWRQVTADVIENGTPMASLPVLTDDYAPVERLLSRLIRSSLGG